MTDSGHAGPTIFVLFGATGDLAKRMVLPAFYQLAQHKLLPDEWLLIGNGRGDVSHEDFRGHVHDVLTEFDSAPEEGPWQEFASRLRFAGGGFEASDPGSLLDVLQEEKQELGEQSQYIHYLAIPPSAFIKVTQGLGEHNLAAGARVVYEKPFGTSPAGYEELDKAVHEVLKEDQVFRIDHFLGKEGTQNLHALRFGNVLFDQVWNGKSIRAVQIDVPETLDIDDRAGFYDETGALLDMVVTHLFQLAAEVAMEPPLSLAAQDLQDARESVIAAFRPLAVEDVVLGQYDGYRQTEGIDPDSKQNTFAAVRLWVDTDRWHGVPFLLRTGKMMAESKQQVSLIFRTADGPLGNAVPNTGNVLTISISGSGDVDLRVVTKKPGPALELTTETASLPLAQADSDPLPPYVRLISDVVIGDRSLFTRPDGLGHAWDAVKPILEADLTPLPYAAHSWGPQAAQDLAGAEGWLLGDGAAANG